MQSHPGLDKPQKVGIQLPSLSTYKQHKNKGPSLDTTVSQLFLKHIFIIIFSSNF